MRPAPRRHPATRLLAPHGRAVEIDDALIPAISALWERGIGTCWSCQGSASTDVAPRRFLGYVVVSDPATTPAALDLLAGRVELRDVRVRRLKALQLDRRERLRLFVAGRGEPVPAPKRFDLDEIPGETFEQWHSRALVAARLAPSVDLTPDEAAEELRLLDEAVLTPVCIEFEPLA